MDKLVNFGILGCARIVRRAIEAGIRGSGMARLAAIASLRPKVAATWAEEFQIPRAFDSYDALLADPEIDAVYIPLPNEQHCPWTLQAAARGKHVLCEKPLALDVTEAERMVATCRERGVILMEAFMWRHHPRVAHARRLIADGSLGELRLVKVDFSFKLDGDDWRLDPARGGGALFDLGCYGINAARLFTGAEPAEVLARAHFDEGGVDLTTAVELRFPGDVLAQVDCSFECPYRNRIELAGTRGAMELAGGVLPAQRAECVLQTDLTTDSAKFTADQYAEQIKAFCQAVARGSLAEPAEDGLANMRALVAARQSMAEQGG